MLAYHGKKTEKTAILAQLALHRKADEIVKGQYWQNGKGCAVGCTLHSNQHAEYEPRFGIPQMLARLEDTIFEGLPNGKAKAWPEAFMNAIRPGADLSRVGWQFLHWLLTDEKVNPGINHPLVRDAIKQCADVLIPLTKGKPTNGSAERSAAYSAESAAYSAESAARNAAYSAESAARSAAYSAASAARNAAYSAASAARSAARSAAYSAASAARSAESAARSAAYSAASAARSAARSAAYSAESAARSAAYVLMSKKLISLLKAA